MLGSCHCGAVHWRFEGVPKSAASCNCSICRRHGALWAYGVQGETFSVEGETRTYVWNTKWLAFHFCGVCACVVGWAAQRPGEDGRVHGAVNLRLAADAAEVQAIPLIHHDTETRNDLPGDGKCVADVWA